MKEALKEMLASKKFLAAAGGALAWIVVRLGAKYGIAVDPEIAAGWADRLLAAAMAYVAGQAAADFGKVAAANGKAANGEGASGGGAQ